MNTKEIKSREIVIHKWDDIASLGVGVPSLIGGFGLIIYGLFATAGILTIPLISGFITLISGIGWAFRLESKCPRDKTITLSLPRKHYVIKNSQDHYIPCFYKYGSLRYLDKYKVFSEIHEASLAYEKAYKEEKFSKPNSSSIMIVYKGKAPRA
ncbi:MAG TPA: hypothetical protein PLR64_00615 [Candidatus Dojkabacteria bacterium]|nr:hypothetical protein [Candidatus Dojkabacteria bacterium]